MSRNLTRLRVMDLNLPSVVCCTSWWHAAVYCIQADKCTTVFEPSNNSGEELFFPFFGNHTIIILRSPQLSCVLHNVSVQRFGRIIMKTIQLIPCPFSLCACCASKSLWVVSLSEGPASIKEWANDSLPLIYTWWSDLFRAAAAEALAWLLTSHAYPAARQESSYAACMLGADIQAQAWAECLRFDGQH